MLAAGADRGHPERPAVRGGDDLHIPAMMLVLPGPPEICPVGTGGGDAVGADDSAVQVEVGVPGGRRPLQCGGQVRGVVGEHGQPLVEIAVGGRHRDPAVPGELGQPGSVDEPPQDEDPLLEDAQGAGVLAGAEPVAVLAQEPGQGLGGLPADIEHGGVGDTGQRVKPLAVRNLIFADLFLPGASPISDGGALDAVRLTPHAVTHRNRHIAEKTSLSGKREAPHLGPLRTPRTHHQLEGVLRPSDRDVCSRRPQRDHGRGHHRLHHP
ncbi:hypothetical protein APS67_005905 [Streptomyces sp. AVP053U2]|nr:hypothetical protein APS67_005905 [Streptomyces sp. AVP053U2]